MIGVCHCGNSLESHYRDPVTGERTNCLALSCDCPAYRDSEKPDTLVPTRVRPAHRDSCECYDCKAWRDQ